MEKYQQLAIALIPIIILVAVGYGLIQTQQMEVNQDNVTVTADGEWKYYFNGNETDDISLTTYEDSETLNVSYTKSNFKVAFLTESKLKATVNVDGMTIHETYISNDVVVINCEKDEEWNCRERKVPLHAF